MIKSKHKLQQLKTGK